MLNRVSDLVKIDVSGLVSKGRFRRAADHVTALGKVRYLRLRLRLAGEGTSIATNIENSENSPVVLVRTGMVATVALNRPGDSNRIDAEMTFGIQEACRLIAEDDGLRLVVLTAAGKVFSVDDGGDTGDSSERMANENDAPGKCSELLAELAIPVLVALNGNATGSGLELALAGDLRICVPSARFGFTGLARGVLPQDGGTQRLPRLVGPAWAQDMLLTGRMVDAEEALTIGLVNRVADEPGGLKAAVDKLAAEITGGSPIGARYAKKAVAKGLDLSLDQGLRLEADLNVILQSTSDRAEGISSFIEKRGPEFKGS